MQISSKLLIPLSPIIGLAALATPVKVRADTIGALQQGHELTLDGFAITNSNAVALTRSGREGLHPAFAGLEDADFAASLASAGGSCLGSLRVRNGLAARASHKGKHAFTSPAPDADETADLSVSRIDLDRGITHDRVSCQNNPSAVPEPESLKLVSLGTVALLAAGWLGKRRGFIKSDIKSSSLPAPRRSAP